MLTEVMDLLNNPERYIVVDTRTFEQYASGHIPGAIWINCYDFLLESTDSSGIKELNHFLSDSLAPLAKFNEQPVVFYENLTGMRAARALWFYNFAGGKYGSVLHGGLQKWISAGGKLQVERLPAANHTETFSVKNVACMLADFHDVLGNLNNRHTVIIDARSEDEYNGISVDKCCTIKGKIPSSINLHWEDLLNENGEFIPKDEIIKIARNCGITPATQIIVYCHRGARSALVWLALTWAGFRNVRNYIGSWHEWTRTEGAPISVQTKL